MITRIKSYANTDIKINQLELRQTEVIKYMWQLILFFENTLRMTSSQLSGHSQKYPCQVKQPSFGTSDQWPRAFNEFVHPLYSLFIIFSCKSEENCEELKKKMFCRNRQDFLFLFRCKLNWGRSAIIIRGRFISPLIISVSLFWTTKRDRTKALKHFILVKAMIHSV